MSLEIGMIVFLSLMVMVWRLPKKTLLWLFGHPAWLEVPFGIAAYALHYGTFQGMIGAAVAVCLCYGFIEICRVIVGYTVEGKYHPGFINWSNCYGSKT